MVCAVMIAREYLHLKSSTQLLVKMQQTYKTRIIKLKELCAFYQNQSCLSNQTKQSFENEPDCLVLNRDPLYLAQTVLLPEPKEEKKKQKESRKQESRKRENNVPKKNVPAVHKQLTFTWPLDGDTFWISSYYGKRGNTRFHSGIDLAAAIGTQVKASAGGSVVFAGYAGAFGNMVLVSHGHHFKTRYAHLSKILVREGVAIKKGQVIGLVGNTGRVSGKNGNHLHFEMLEQDNPINPIHFLV
jgi:murein DD-endopeptidase MepM/ murein hydrolase activator NlpD